MVTSPALTLVNGTGQPSVAVSAAQAVTSAVQPVSVASQISNPYQGASLTASTSPTAHQPMNILALQQLLASTGQGSLLTNGAAGRIFSNSTFLGSHKILLYYCQSQTKGTPLK